MQSDSPILSPSNDHSASSQQPMKMFNNNAFDDDRHEPVKASTTINIPPTPSDNQVDSHLELKQKRSLPPTSAPPVFNPTDFIEPRNDNLKADQKGSSHVNEEIHEQLGGKRSNPPKSPPPAYIPSSALTDNQTHTKLEEKRSAPPITAPPVYFSTISSEPLFPDPLDSENDQASVETIDKEDLDSDGDDKGSDTNNNLDGSDIDEDVSEKGEKPKGILHYRGTVRKGYSGDSPPKKVTFGALPRRQGDVNPCMVLVLVITFIITLISFLLILMVIKGSIATTCSCKDDIRKVKDEFQESAWNCPVGWSVGEKTCYGSSLVQPFLETYEEARYSCSKHGAYILSLETRKEADWFTKNILEPRRQYDTNVSDIFLGIKPRSMERNYYWESNIPFYAWKENIPKAGDNKCFTISNDENEWKTTNCTVKHIYYCEKPKYSN